MDQRQCFLGNLGLSTRVSARRSVMPLQRSTSSLKTCSLRSSQCLDERVVVAIELAASRMVREERAFTAITSLRSQDVRSTSLLQTLSRYDSV